MKKFLTVQLDEKDLKQFKLFAKKKKISLSALIRLIIFNKNLNPLEFPEVQNPKLEFSSV
jgi:hypothetical protein